MSSAARLWVASVLLLAGPRAGGCRRSSRQPPRANAPRAVSAHGKASFQILQRGLGPRHVLASPRPARAYNFRFEIIQTRKQKRNRILLHGTLARQPATPTQGRTARLVVTKLDTVRPASLSRLLLKTVVGRPLSTLSQHSHATASFVTPTALPRTPLGPGAHWKVTETIGSDGAGLRLFVEADFRMEQTQGRTTIHESSLLTCPNSAGIACHGTIHADWHIADGQTRAIQSRAKLILGKGPGEVTETQVFEAHRLPRQTIP